MFEGLMSLRSLKHGMVINGPHEGEVVYANGIEYISLIDMNDLPEITHVSAIEATSNYAEIKEYIYRKHDYVHYGDRRYI